MSLTTEGLLLLLFWKLSVLTCEEGNGCIPHKHTHKNYNFLLIPAFNILCGTSAIHAATKRKSSCQPSFLSSSLQLLIV